MLVGGIYRRGANYVVWFSVADSAGAGITGLTVKFSIYDPIITKYWDNGSGDFDSGGEVLNTATAEIGDGLYEYVLTDGYAKALGGTSFHVHIEATDSVAGDVYDTAETFISTVDVIKAKTDNLPHSLKKSTAIAKFKFAMLDATTRNPTAGFTITAVKKLDADVTWTAMPGSGTIVDNGSGAYSIDIAAADTNGDTGVWKFTASGAETTLIMFVTEAV